MKSTIRKLPLMLVFIMSFMVASCTHAAIPIPEQIPETMEAACDAYQSSKSIVQDLREAIKANPEAAEILFGKSLMADLREFDTSELPEIDKAGKMICDVSAATRWATAPNTNRATPAWIRETDWDSVLSRVLRITAGAVELRQAGLI